MILCAILHNAPLEKATPLWLARNHDKKGKGKEEEKAYRRAKAKAQPEEAPGPLRRKDPGRSESCVSEPASKEE